ncbi:hypothetical protein ZIOFF_006657 [Zingiber officinale]|uniref:KOW domain-containing protein n=1 Tax=Zingiber officinale TaxID=94328 RepID=A0A8J5IER1_ZINOF|nr:hypothetical protein ZIOFF_006657 [Zingiber officinale]
MSVDVYLDSTVNTVKPSAVCDSEIRTKAISCLFHRIAMAAAAARSVLRSSSLRGRTPRVGRVMPATPSRHPLRRLPNQRPAVAERYLRAPLAASFCVESLMPLHSATAAALLTSMLGVSHGNYGGLYEVIESEKRITLLFSKELVLDKMKLDEGHIPKVMDNKIFEITMLCTDWSRGGDWRESFRIVAGSKANKKMVKFLKPNKAVIILQGRFAGRKAVIVRAFDDGTRERPYGHCLVAGVAKYPKKVIRKDSAKKTAKKSRVKPFLKLVNYNHIMPTRYTLDVDLKDTVTLDALQSRDKKVSASKETKARFEERFKTGKNRWFFTKLSCHVDQPSVESL